MALGWLDGPLGAVMVHWKPNPRVNSHTCSLNFSSHHARA